MRWFKRDKQGFILISIVFLVFLKCAYCSENVTESGITESPDSDPDLNNGTLLANTTADSASPRNSRQLWSFLKKVVKTSIDSNSNGDSKPNPVSGGIGALASLFGSSIANSLNSGGSGGGGSGLHVPSTPSFGQQNPQFANPNEYMHYLLLNSQAQQHTSIPHYHQQQQQQQQMESSTSDLINKYQEQMTSSTNLESVSTTGNQILSKLAFGSIFEDFDLENFSNFLSFGTVERMVDKVSKFDKLKCIPRLLCQMVAKRAEDAKTTTTTTTTSTTRRPKRRADDDDDRAREEKAVDDSDEDDESEEERVVIKPAGSNRSGRFINVNGADSALEQFVKFLELMQLKDWSFYPYLNGAYQGSQVARTEDCANRFPSCPFSDDQLVYYFNNYNGGFFQSI